ncbi:Actin cytoskeleton-regulatory complex protein END3, partial [Bienertia sinuspersici]
MQAIKQFVATQKVGLACLLETKVKASNLGSLYSRVFGGWCFTSNSDEHYNGRIVLAWNPKSFKVIILDKTAQMIHCVMQPCGGRNEFYCTFIYAFNEAIKREQLWQQLCELNSRQKGPWVLMGDFNVVMNSEERIGSNVRSRDFNERIANAWRWSGSGTNMYCLIKKLKKVKGTLIELNRRGFCELHAGVTNALMQMTEAQTKLQQRPLDNNVIMAERTAAKEYQERNKVYMQFLRQKAKCSWIKDGDENTALFHQSIKQRRLQNNIYAIKNGQGVLVEDQEKVANAFVEYYQSLL